MGRPKKNNIIPQGNSSINTVVENPILPTEVGEIKAACVRIGMGLDDYLLAIKTALVATRITVDKYGQEHEEPDYDKRLRAAVMGLEVEGYIRSKTTTVDNSKHNHVTYQWLSQPVTVNNVPTRLP